MEPLDLAEIRTFKEWTKKHRRKFRDENYTFDNFIELALAVGFSRRTLAEVILECKRDIDTMSTENLRVWYNLQRDWEYIQERARPYMAEKWERLVDWYTDHDEVLE